jgi:hypothetical protein
MWEPRRLTTLWASTACYRDSFTFFTSIIDSSACSSNGSLAKHEGPVVTWPCAESCSVCPIWCRFTVWCRVTPFLPLEWRLNLCCNTHRTWSLCLLTCSTRSAGAWWPFKINPEALLMLIFPLDYIHRGCGHCCRRFASIYCFPLQDRRAELTSKIDSRESLESISIVKYVP